MTIDTDLYARLLFERALEAVPPMVRHDVLLDEGMRQKWGVGIRRGVRLGPDGPSFERSALYDTLRSAIDALGVATDIADDNEVIWSIVVEPGDKGPLYFKLFRQETVFHLDDHSPLARDRSIRIAWLDRVSESLLLPPDWVKSRRMELNEAPLTDDAFASLMEDIETMPSMMDVALRNGLERRRADFRLFAPNQAEYYTRLVGQLGAQTTTMEYFEEVAGPLIERLVGQKGVDGLRWALLACGHSEITAKISLTPLDIKEVRDVFEWIAAHGDPISRIAGVEVYFYNMADFPELEGSAIRIIDAILAEDVGDVRAYKALSAVFASSIGVIARERVFPDAPPFFRRQAALAHASLVVRALNDVGSDPLGVEDWLTESGSPQIAFLQELIDLRREPRWLPEYATAEQLRAEMIGRLHVVAQLHSEDIETEALRALLIGPDSKLSQAEKWPRPFLPGPLEGSSRAITPLAEEILEDARRAFSAEELNPSTFLRAVNIAYISGDVGEVASLAANALKRLDYIVKTGEEEPTSFQVLAALSTLGAAARNEELARHICVLTRIKRRQGLFDEDPENDVRIALIAAAAFEDNEAWAVFVGEWIREICFSLAARGRAGNLLMMIRRLRHLEPALSRHLSRAEAALSVLQYQA